MSEGVESGNLFEQLEGLEENVLLLVQVAMENELHRVQDDAKHNAPTDTGELANSIIVQSEIDGNTVTGIVAATAYHAVFVEMGTGPKGQANHAGTAPIPVAYRASGWVWYSEKHKQYYRTNGMPARPYLYPAWVVQRDKIKAAIQDYVAGGL